MKQQISYETATRVQSLIGAIQNFKVTILNLELDILDLTTGILSLGFY